MSKGYKLYSGITMGSSILGTCPLPKTIRVARDSIKPTLLLTMHPHCSLTASDLSEINRKKGACHQKKNSLLRNCPS